MASARVYHSLPICSQFYRVEVKVLPPEADAAPRTRSVLRRFSHFTKLYAKVRLKISTILSQYSMQKLALLINSGSSASL